METPYTKRVNRFLETVAATSTANDDQVVLRTSTPGTPTLTLDDIKKEVDEMNSMFVFYEKAKRNLEQSAANPGKGQSYM